MRFRTSRIAPATAELCRNVRLVDGSSFGRGAVQALARQSPFGKNVQADRPDLGRFSEITRKPYGVQGGRGLGRTERPCARPMWWLSLIRLELLSNCTNVWNQRFERRPNDGRRERVIRNRKSREQPVPLAVRFEFGSRARLSDGCRAARANLYGKLVLMSSIGLYIRYIKIQDSNTWIDQRPVATVATTYLRNIAGKHPRFK